MESDFPKPTILIIDDEAGPRDALKVILRPFFNLYAAETGHTAIQMLKEHRIDLITLDLKLPDRQGMDLLQEIKAEWDAVEVIIITGYGSLKSAMDGIRFGAAGYLLKPFNVMELIALTKQTLEKKQRLDCIRKFLTQSDRPWGTEHDSAAAWKQLHELYSALPKAKPNADLRFGDNSELTPLLSDLLEAKDRHLFNHSSRVSFYASLLAKHVNLSASEQQAVAIGAFLHDIGKIAVKNRGHPEVGARMILPLRLPAEVGQIIAYHHEWYDGSGYPHGLQGEGIPLPARIVALVQAFDHLVTGPSSQQVLSVAEAVERVRNQAGSRFDPTLVEQFAQVAIECKTSLPALAPVSKPAILPGP